MIKRIKVLKYPFATLLFVAGIALASCETDVIDDALQSEIIETNKPNTMFNFATVPIKKTVNFLKARDRARVSIGEDPLSLNIDVNSIRHEDITNTEANLTVIDAETQFEQVDSKVIQVIINGEVQTRLVNLIPDNSNTGTEDEFTGVMAITNLEGLVYNNFVVNQGEITGTYNLYNIMPDPCEGITCGIELEEVVVTATTSTVTANNYTYNYGPIYNNSYYWRYNGNSYISMATGYMSYWQSQPCPNANQVRDRNGQCVKKPCDKNPIDNPEIAPQKGASGKKGGMFGCTRYGGNNCSNPDGRNKKHNGIDIKSNYGDPIFATHDGVARLVTQYNKRGTKVIGAGHYVEITSIINNETVKILYFHMQEENRKSGEVKAGDIIGYQGYSGNLGDAIKSGGVDSHVHIKVKVNGIVVNPNEYLGTKFDSETGEIIEVPTNCN